MRISVIVPAFNEEKLLPRCLEHIGRAVAGFHRREWEVEVVVCDNNSTDRTGALALEAGARVVVEPVNQISRARNRGAAAATGDWLLFIDADSFPDLGLFEAVARAIESGRVVGGGALVRFDGVVGVGRVLVEVWNWISRWNRWMAGSCVFCDARVFHELGGFSQALYASEEIDFSRRLKRAARGSGRHVEILTGHRLSSSGRKLHLYTLAEHARMFRRTMFSRGANLRRREELEIWYDGRR